MITINVTQEDIDKAMAIPRFSSNWGEDCPIGQALEREGFSDKWVYSNILTINGTRYVMPPDMVKFIENVDKHHRIKWNPQLEYSRGLDPIVPTKFVVPDYGVPPEVS